MWFPLIMGNISGTLTEALSYMTCRRIPGTFTTAPRRKDVFPRTPLYKVYDALFGLEEGVIAPDASVLPWDGTALSLCGLELRSGFGIRYGKFCELVFSVHRFGWAPGRVQGLSAQNKLWKPGTAAQGCPPTGWKLPENFSPGADHALLAKLYRNDFGFAPANIRAVKDAMLLSQTPDGSLYGKTGTTDG